MRNEFYLRACRNGSAISHSWLEPGGIHHSTVSKGKIELLSDAAKLPQGAAGSGHSPGAAVQLLCTQGGQDFSPAVSPFQPL